MVIATELPPSVIYSCLTIISLHISSVFRWRLSKEIKRNKKINPPPYLGIFRAWTWNTLGGGLSIYELRALRNGNQWKPVLLLVVRRKMFLHRRLLYFSRVTREADTKVIGWITTSVASQYHRYLEVAAEFDHNEKGPNACLHFWLVNKNQPPQTLSSCYEGAVCSS